MRNYVSKMLIGTAVANTDIAQKDLEALTEGQLIAYDYDTGLNIVAATKNIGFAKGTSVLGEPLVAGPIAKAGIEDAILNPYEAAQQQVRTLTVSAVPTVGKTCIFKVTYHDNLSIIPNKIKQTIIAVVADAANTASTTTWATAIAAEFNKQTPDGKLFVNVASATNVVTFTSLVISTQSKYNGIDRPEALVFELAYPSEDSALGVYVQAQTIAPKLGQGDASKIAWLEEQHMGRHGFSDRRMWNDTKKYPSQVTAGETYATLVITANSVKEGDLQGTRSNPVGAIIAGDGATLALILTDLATGGIVPTTVAAS